MTLRALSAGLVLWPLLAAGCAGTGRVHMLPPTRADMPPDQPLITTVPLTAACYRISDDGELHVGLTYRVGSLLGEAFDLEWHMSLVLEELPAGSEKLYRVLDRAARWTYSRGGDHRRGRSLHGIVVIESPRGGRLRGRFHIWVRQQQFVFLTGWTPELNRAPLQIMVGHFEAVEDPAACERVVTATEADGLERPPAGTATTQPGIRWIRTRPAEEARSER